MWIEFLEKREFCGISVSRPFLDLKSALVATELEFFSDTSLKSCLGFRARFQKQWTFGQWPTNFITKYSPSIEYAELFALLVAIYVWSPFLRNQRVIIFCDNQAVVAMVNNITSKCKNCMVLIRKLVLWSLQFNFRVFMKYIKLADNEVADSLSQLDFDCFSYLAQEKHLDPMPQPLPDELWPIEKLWMF